MDEDLPVGAFILSMLGGILILAAGIYLAIVGGIFSAAGNSLVGGIAEGLGGLGVLLGFLLVGLSFAMFFQPDHHLAYGIAIIVVSLMSAITGAGFILGLILGLVGGILAVLFQPSEDLELPGGLPSRSPWGRRCENCSEWVTGQFSYCPHCGSPMR